MLDIGFDVTKNQYSFGCEYSDNDSTEKFSQEILRLVDNKLYLNLGSLDSGAKYIGGSEADDLLGDDFSGWFMIPLPEDLPKEKVVNENTRDILPAMVEKVVKDLPKEGVDGNYTISLKTTDDYLLLLNSLKSYVDNDLKDLVKNQPVSANAIEEIDWNKYLTLLLDTYEKDVRDIVKEYGETLEITEDKLDQILKEVKDQDLNKVVKEYLEKAGSSGISSEERLDKSLAEFSEELEKSIQTVSKTAEAFEECTMKIAADDDGYTISARIVEKTNSDEKGSVDLKFRIIPGSGSVSKPSDTRGLKPIVDTLFTSYSNYLEKSRKSSDISMLADSMAAAEKLACDVTYDFPAGTKFIIKIANGKLEHSVEASGSSVDTAAANQDWEWLGDFYGARSQALKASAATIIGVIQDNGTVEWSAEDTDKNFRDFVSFSPDFMRRYNLQ